MPRLANFAAGHLGQLSNSASLTFAALSPSALWLRTHFCPLPVRPSRAQAQPQEPFINRYTLCWCMRMCEKGRGWIIAREKVGLPNSRDCLRPLNRRAEPKASSGFRWRTRTACRNVAEEGGRTFTHAHLNKSRRFLRQHHNPPPFSLNTPLTFKGAEPTMCQTQLTLSPVCIFQLFLL